jgi:flavin-binding protein dodecin
MAVASVTKITAASSEGFDAAVREGLARANKTLRFFANRAAKKWPLRGSLKLGVKCL